MAEAVIDTVRLMRQITLKVKFKREQEMKVRLWVAARLITIAARITGMGIEFEGTSEAD